MQGQTYDCDEVNDDDGSHNEDDESTGLVRQIAYHK
jgi:hypothetical protein